MTSDHPAFSALLRNHLLAFVKKYFREMHDVTLEDVAYLDHLCCELTRFNQESRRLVVNMPPRHGKTEVISVAFAAWMLGHNPREQVLILCHSEDLAKEIARKLRTLIDSPFYQMAFPGTRIKTGHAAAMDFATTSGGRVFAAPITGQYTGFGATLIIIDDPVDIKDADDEDHHLKVIDRYESIVANRLNHPITGKIVMVGHRLHARDLSAHLVEFEEAYLVSLPFEATKDTSLRLTHGTWTRRKGEILRPGAFGPGQIERMRRRPNFASLYQQDPRPSCYDNLCSDDFRYFEATRRPAGPYVVSIDPGFGQTESNSYTVIQTWACPDSNVPYLLLEQWRERAPFESVIKAVRKQISAYSNVTLLIENSNFAPALRHYLRSSTLARIVNIPIPQDSKIERLQRHIASIRAGTIRLPSNRPWTNGYICEFVNFSSDGFADQVDATTQFLDFMLTGPVLAKPRPKCFIMVTPRPLGNQRSRSRQVLNHIGCSTRRSR